MHKNTLILNKIRQDSTSWIKGEEESLNVGDKRCKIKKKKLAQEKEMVKRQGRILCLGNGGGKAVRENSQPTSGELYY